MKTQRHYFIATSLDDLETFEKQLEAAGVDTPQCHLLSDDDSQAAGRRHLNAVASLARKDMIHSAEVGALVGVVLALAILLIASLTGLPAATVGWVPFVFLAIVVLGFCTWEGGLFGIQRTNVRFRQFEKELALGNHVFFVDLRRDQESDLDMLLARHPELRGAGTDSGTPDWIHVGQRWMLGFVDRNLLSQSQIG